MKKSNLITLAVILSNLIAGKCAAQWTSVYTENTASFRDAAFPTDNTGYIAASDTGGAVVLRTADGGITWNKKRIHEWGFIDKVAMSDSMNGYLIKGGAPVQILRTTNGFNTYTIRNLDSSFVVQSLQLLNDSTGFYLNNATRLRKFENNGSSFSHVIDTLFDGQDLQFVGSRTGYLDNGSRLLKTTDAGTSWNHINSNLGFYTVAFYFADSLNGYFSDTGKIFKTTDGGITFSPRYSFRNVFGFAARGNFCIAANDSGNVAYTANGGATWQRETTGINFIAAEPYKVVTTPGGHCFLFSQYCGEVRKRQPVAGAGISDISGDRSIIIYPNPLTSQTTISFDQYQPDTEIKITDITGKTIKTIHFSGTQVVLDRGGMQTGAYLLTITNDQNNIIATKTVIIQ